jgi:hypothetical protein
MLNFDFARFMYKIIEKSHLAHLAFWYNAQMFQN